MMHPYRPGRVPVVLVHGTVSSPARWADIVNELQNDPKLRERIQLWLFTYNTNNPILLSAADLRQGLQRIRKELDPDGLDPALNEVVVIGHSQGGLLTRLMVTDSGTRFWDSYSSIPFDEAKMSPETRALAQRTCSSSTSRTSRAWSSLPLRTGAASASPRSSWGSSGSPSRS